MRLWHYELIPYLPNSQLAAQWRELNSIYKKQDRHLLINYIYNYDREYLLHYSMDVVTEMLKRGFEIRSWDNHKNYFGGTKNSGERLRYAEHNLDYLIQCFYNLQEKYQRGQYDFSGKQYERLCNFVIEKMKNGL